MKQDNHRQRISPPVRGSWY